MGAFDGEDYKALLEMEEFKSHVMLSASHTPNTLLCYVLTAGFSEHDQPAKQLQDAQQSCQPGHQPSQHHYR